MAIEEDIGKAVSLVDSFLKVKDGVRERVIREVRGIIRESGSIIVKIHSGDLSTAALKLEALRNSVRSLTSFLSSHPELLYSNLLYGALSEYVEAELLYSIVTSGRVLTHEELGVHPVPYLQGLLDLVGEIKRRILDILKGGNIAEAWNLFKVAEAIYESAKNLSYPEALIPGVRRKIDVSRSIVESLRSFLTDMQLRIELIRKLSTLQTR
ncbi:MAG: haloacid dehalogenase [Desulfurococcales archaeon ex4484_204]|nr:MAG: haloacid dehalogenase [Desulfurococcales archaeon ex4484_204]